MSERKIAWGRLVSPEFKQKVIRICDLLGWDEDAPNRLMACMHFETGGTFSPSIRNAAGSSGRGLIQFMGATARRLGTSTAALERMSALRQLDYVYAYFKPYAGKAMAVEDMYMAILWPKGVRKPLQWVLWAVGSQAYRYNKGLDTNRDGRVTKQEAASKVIVRLREGRLAQNMG